MRRFRARSLADMADENPSAVTGTRGKIAMAAPTREFREKPATMVKNEEKHFGWRS